MEIIIVIVCLIIGIFIIGNLIDHNDKIQSEKSFADDTAKARHNMHNHSYLSKDAPNDGWCLVKLCDFRFAFVNANGDYLGNYIFIDASPFKDGTAIVNLINRGYCILRSDGTFALSPEKEPKVERYIKPLFSDYFLLSRCFSLKKDTVYYKYYIIKRDGTIITKTPFDKYLEFKDGIFRVRTGSLISEITENGGLLNPPFRKKIEIGNGLFKVMTEEYRWGVFDSSSKQIIIPCRFSEVAYIPSLDHFIVKTYKEDSPSGKSYVIDRYGKQIIPPLYSDISFYGNRFYHIGNFRSEGTGLLCGLCKTDGTLLIQPKFQDIWIGETGFMVSSKNGRCGIVNHYGNSALEYDSYKCVYLSNWDFPVSYSGSDYNGKPHAVAYQCHPTYLIVCKNKKYGVVDISGNAILPLEYDSIDSCDNEYNVPARYIIKKNNLFGVVNLRGEIIIPIVFDKIEDKLDVGSSIYIPKYHIGVNSNINHDMEEIEHYDKYCKGKARYFLLTKNNESYTVNQNNEILTPKPTREELLRQRVLEKDSKFKDDTSANSNSRIILPKSEQKSTSTTIDKSSHFILFFDTETTGLPIDYNAPASDTSNWPRLVQLSWILTDSNFKIVNKQDLIIKPNGYSIPSNVSRLHGISTERALKDGVELIDALKIFSDDISKASMCVGHNISFDKKIVACELYRLRLKDFISAKKSICTMKSTINLCRIPGCYGYKYPKLQDLHYTLFGFNFDDAHNAMSDVTATVKCYIELYKKNLL